MADQPLRATYIASGVDIAAGEAVAERIKGIVGPARHPGVLGGIGGFGGMFALDRGAWRDPVLVAGADGIGTKALVAESTGRLATVGIDLVAMCVDDIACCGAEPMFLLDYLAVGKLDADAVAEIVSGVARGCDAAGCALLGGETAEHPGAMRPEQFDLAGFAVGIVERDQILGPEKVRPGDVLVGLASPGLRCNGYSLARHVLFDVAHRRLDAPAWHGSEHTLADELSRPSTIYASAVLAAIAAGDEAFTEGQAAGTGIVARGVHAAAHITGGGIPGNLSRVLPSTCDAYVESSSWTPPQIFGEIARVGRVEKGEMARVFNLGIGMILVCAPGAVSPVQEALSSDGIESSVIGSVVDGIGDVRFDPVDLLST